MKIQLINIITIGAILLTAAAGHAQNKELTIDECYARAQQHYPLVKQYELIEKSEKYSLNNAAMAYIPQLSISASATYQTDVTSFPQGIPGVTLPQLDKDQYQAIAELTQIVWDSGAVRAKRNNIKAQSEVSRREYEVEMYKLRDRINNLYFGILLIDNQISRLDVLMTELASTYKRVENCIDNGVANESDLDIVEVEVITANQNKNNLETLRNVYTRMLSAMIGEEDYKNVQLRRPEGYLPQSSAGSSANKEHEPSSAMDDTISGQEYFLENKRPELALFEARIKELESRRSFITAKNLPNIGLFVRAGYGRPGLNMFDTNFTTYAIGGIKLSWNISSLYTRKNEIRSIDTGLKNIEVMKDTFIFNSDLSSGQQNAEIQKFQKIIEDDARIIELRGKIRKSSENKLDNGTISTSDLIREITKEEIAVQDKIKHEIELLKSIYDLKNTLNN